MLFAVLSGFFIACALLFAGKLAKSRLSLLLAVLPASLFAYFVSFLPNIAEGRTFIYSYSWIPSLGIDLNFYLDGLSLLFSFLITGIGTLVYLYASVYLKGHHYLDRFFGYLSLFMGSMLGLVLSDNVITLFIFWELTSISSFFLIGFNNDNQASRKSSMLALAITGGGGFLLLGAFILLGTINGDFSIQSMLVSSALLKSDQLYGLILFFLFAGAFTKSAQFPFHFWLPGAMKAPTPVSAYLHSATMVKAGIYLLARFTPVFGQHIYWNTTLLIVGGVTMLYAAFHSIFRTDLKAILAYSTVAALGMLVFLLGIGSKEALIAASVFILVHALYKAALFLTAGAIDHEAGTRDVTRLSGLRKVLLPLAIAGALAALSNAGIPLTFGFLGKDLIYEATLGADYQAYLLTGLVIITNIFLLYAGYIAGIKPFIRELPHAFEQVHLPHFLMWLPPLLLSMGGILLGSFPGIIDKSLIQPVVQSIHGTTVDISLKIWHGFNLVLLLSVVTLALGALLIWLKKPSHESLTGISKFEMLSPSIFFHKMASLFEALARWYTSRMKNGYLRMYMIVILVFTIILLAYRLFTNVPIYLDQSKLSSITIYEVMVAGIMTVSIFITVLTSSRLTAIVAMGVIGYCICLLFVFYSAPDLAMTQFTIETLTVILFVLVLFRLPPFLNHANTFNKIRDAIIALCFGSLITIIALEVLNENVTKDISQYYGDNAYTLAKGKNVVNVILVDFRGIDTLIEITVLTIAALGVYSLLNLKITGNEKE